MIAWFGVLFYVLQIYYDFSGYSDMAIGLGKFFGFNFLEKDNGFGEIYVNSKVRDGSEISELMKVFVEDKAYNNKFPITSKSKHRYKETEEGQQIMCEIMERIAIEERREGRKEGRREGRKEGQTAVNKLNEILIQSNRLEDLKRSAIDYEYQNRLMSELLPRDFLKNDDTKKPK